MFIRSISARRQDLRVISAGLLLLFLNVAWQPSAAGSQGKADRIEIRKSEKTMTLLRDGKVLKVYKVALSTVPLGPKEREGDHKVPEGLYIVDAKNAHSKFHLALHVSYPNAADRERARKLGVKPGGNIEIHGLGSKFAWVGSLHREVDWTDGCIAVTNSEIEEIWPMVSIGTPIEIRP
ncbi:MAG: L,D-transpeptidase family protein [Candidatus Acidiferrum sp.]